MDLVSSPGDETPYTRADAYAAALPGAVLQAAEWRYLVRMLYADAGSPAVPDYPRPLVQEVLWGHAHAGAGFFEALYSALAKPAPATTARSGAPRTPRRVVSEAFSRRARSEPAPFEFDHTQTTARAAVVVSDDGTLRVRSGGIEDQLRPPYQQVPGTRPAPASGTRGKHGFTAPSPNGISTIADFVEALGLLQRWSGLNLREIEERSRKSTVGGPDGQVVWLARSTISDMLKRMTKLPKPERFGLTRRRAGSPRPSRSGGSPSATASPEAANTGVGGPAPVPPRAGRAAKSSNGGLDPQHAIGWPRTQCGANNLLDAQSGEAGAPQPERGGQDGRLERARRAGSELPRAGRLMRLRP